MEKQISDMDNFLSLSGQVEGAAKIVKGNGDVMRGKYIGDSSCSSCGSSSGGGNCGARNIVQTKIAARRK